jgi:DnaJ domain
MINDPAGHYAALEVDPAAAPEAIAAAYRRKARVLHPDVMGTGDATAFMRIKLAYDVLGDAARRAAYDRSALAPGVSGTASLEPAPRVPRLSDLPVALWVGLGGVFCLAAIMAMVQFAGPSPHPQGPIIRPFAPPAAVARPRPTPPPAVASADGPMTHYVLPGSGDTVVWRRDTKRDDYRPAGYLPAFSSVGAVGLVAQHGLVEIRLADGGSGFIDAMRLEPGDRAAARRAYCAYNAGPSPQNGEVLDRHGAGGVRLSISNRDAQPAVVKLRDPSGRTAATVYVAPGSTAAVAELPDTAYRPDFAIGELWSRACNTFAAGMRVERFAVDVLPSDQSPLLIPPDLSVTPAPADIPDAEFEHE